jgi:hypothetical protein
MKTMQCNDKTWSVYWIIDGDYAHVPGVPWVRTKEEADKYKLDLESAERLPPWFVVGK